MDEMWFSYTPKGWPKSAIFRLVFDGDDIAVDQRYAYLGKSIWAPVVWPLEFRLEIQNEGLRLKAKVERAE